MPTPRQFLLGIFTISILALTISQHSLAQTAYPTHESQAAKDHLRLGIDFYLTQELDSAIQEFQQAQQHWPEYANTHWNLGVGLAKLGDLEGAMTAWGKAERIDPSVAPIRFNLSALVTYNYGISLLQRGHLSKAITEWEQALRVQPDLAEVHYALGQAYQIKGNTILSQKYLEYAVFWAPDWAQAINQLGMAYYQNGEYEKAIDHLQQAIRLKPNYPQAYANLGLLYLAKGNLGEAEKGFTAAINLDPGLPQAHFNLAVLNVKKKNWVTALDQLTTTIRLNPQFADAQAVIGSVYSSVGNWPLAIQAWRIALSLNPYASYAHNLHYNIGMAHRVTNANTKALHAFQRAARLHPHSAQTHFQLGVTYETLGDWTQASDHYLVAVRQYPGWALPYFKLGLVRYNQGLLDAAIESHQRAITIQPAYGEAQYQLGVTLRAANRPQESLIHIRIAAEQGMEEAQEMLGTMYANGSGTDRDLVQAMRWWFKAANGMSYGDQSEVAQAHLSRLRSWVFSHQENPNYIEQILEGFQAIRGDIRRHFNNDPHSTNSVGVTLAQSGKTNEAIPILLQEAFALNVEAHHYLEYLITTEGELLHHSRILEYISQTAEEGSPRSCQFLKTLSVEQYPTFVRHDSRACSQ